MKKTLIVLFCLISCGCTFLATYKTEQINLIRDNSGNVRLNTLNNPPNVSLGMSAEDVKKAIGEPSKIITQNTNVIYHYNKEGTRWAGILIPMIPLGRERYELTFNENRLESILERTTY